MADPAPPEPPRWMSVVLRLAAAYNLAWGTWIILWPAESFAFSGLMRPGEPNPYPQLWQCLGMVIGVYGVGYGIAAANPVRHWPIVAVGLLGKLFGPAGYLFGLVTGDSRPETGWMLLANDLVWWIPFALILRAAWRNFRDDLDAPASLERSEALRRARTHDGGTLAELAAAGPLLVVCVRHLGCIFCRESIAEVAKLKDQLSERGVTAAVVHVGRDELARLVFGGVSGDHLPRVADPAATVHRAFAIRRASPWGLVRPRVMLAGLGALRRGHRAGPRAGDPFRLGGAFLIDGDQVLAEYRDSGPEDRADYLALVDRGLRNRPIKPAG